MLDIRNLTVSFGVTGGTVTVVDNVSMMIDMCSTVCIIGESGSGKSVLIQAVLRLLPPGTRMCGNIMLGDRDILAMNGRELRQLRGNIISYIPQGGGNSLNPLLKIGYQVGETLTIHRGYTKRAAVRKAVDLMYRFNMGNEQAVACMYPNMLSGGMRQRALIAMGVAPEAGMLIADEPTKGLDSDRVDMVVECFRSLKETTLICVTHDISFARKVADRVAIIYASQLVEYSDADEFYKSPLHPYSKSVLMALPENGLHVTEGYSPSHMDYRTKGCRFYDRCGIRRNRCQNENPPDVQVDGRMVKCFEYAY